MSAQRIVVRVLLAVGLSVMAAGLVVGLVPTHYQGWSCGSAFRSGPGANPFTPTASACDDRRSSTRTPAVVLLALGGAVTAAGAVTWISQPGQLQRMGLQPQR